MCLFHRKGKISSPTCQLLPKCRSTVVGLCRAYAKIWALTLQLQFCKKHTVLENLISCWTWCGNSQRRKKKDSKNSFFSCRFAIKVMFYSPLYIGLLFFLPLNLFSSWYRNTKVLIWILNQFHILSNQHFQSRPGKPSSKGKRTLPQPGLIWAQGQSSTQGHQASECSAAVPSETNRSHYHLLACTSQRSKFLIS